MNRITSEACKQLIQNNGAELIDIREPWEVEICSIGGTPIPCTKSLKWLNQWINQSITSFYAKQEEELNL